MRRLLLMLGLTGVVLGCASIENKMVYYPRSHDPALESNANGQEVTLTNEAGEVVSARWYPYPRAQGAVLYCPGNAGNLQARSSKINEMWVGLGQSVLIFDYPGFGKSAGSPSEKGCYSAATTAYQWLVREQKMAPERIVLYGESLGGGVAVDLATKQPHAALVLERSFTSVPDVAEYQMPLVPTAFMTNRFDSLAKIPLCRRPVFIAGGDKDALIPLHQSEKLKRACTAPSQLFVMKGVGHNDPLPADYYPAVRTFLAQYANLGWDAK